MLQQQLAQQQEQLLHQKQLLQQQMVQHQMEQQEQMVQQHVVQPQAVPQQDVQIIIEMLNGKPITVTLKENDVKPFIDDLTLAVNDATVFRINDIFINGRQVATYKI